MGKPCVLLSMFILGFICSCENEPYEGLIFIQDTPEIDFDIPDDFENSFYSKLNDEEFMVQNIYTVLSNDTDNGSFIAITGSQNNYHSIIVYMPSDIATGTFYYNAETIIDNPNLNVTYSNLADLLESGTGDGLLTISEHDTVNRYIKGSFNCVVYSGNNSIQTITDGRFEVIY